jgi:anti-sigma factor RsiW
VSDDSAIDDVDCIDLVEWTTDYFEGALSPHDARRLEAHLRDCDGCTEYLAQMRATQDALGAPDAAVLPAPGRDRLIAAFRAWKAEPRD